MPDISPHRPKVLCAEEQHNFLLIAFARPECDSTVSSFPFRLATALAVSVSLHSICTSGIISRPIDMHMLNDYIVETLFR